MLFDFLNTSGVLIFFKYTIKVLMHIHDIWIYVKPIVYPHLVQYAINIFSMFKYDRIEWTIQITFKCFRRWRYLIGGFKNKLWKIILQNYSLQKRGICFTEKTLVAQPISFMLIRVKWCVKEKTILFSFVQIILFVYYVYNYIPISV